MSDRSDPRPTESPRRTAAYLRTILGMNPVWESEQILLARRKALALSVTAAGDQCSESTDQRASRKEGLERLKHVQEKFFELSDPILMSKLDALDANRHPELAASVIRLKACAKRRQQILSMFDDRVLNQDLVAALCNSLTMPQSEARLRREEYIRSLSTRRRLRQARRSAKRIRNSYPEVFELDRDWLTIVGGLKARPIRFLQLSTDGWFMVICGISVIVGLILSWLD